MAKFMGLAVAWMRKEDWPRWLALDPNFQPDYDHWLRRMEATIKELERKGTPFEKVIIDPDEFVEWCRVNGSQINSKSRSAFAAAALAIRHGHGSARH